MEWGEKNEAGREGWGWGSAGLAVPPGLVWVGLPQTSRDL